VRLDFRRIQVHGSGSSRLDKAHVQRRIAVPKTLQEAYREELTVITFSISTILSIGITSGDPLGIRRYVKMPRNASLYSNRGIIFCCSGQCTERSRKEKESRQAIPSLSFGEDF
jgi:hypothetical protein